MKKLTLTLIFITILIIQIGCINAKSAGEYGTSGNKIISKKLGFYLCDYFPDKYKLTLLNKSIIEIDTAWCETKWVYDNDGNPKADKGSGQNFIIPLKKDDVGFNFEFHLLDTANQAFSNGMDSSRCVLSTISLKDTIAVVVFEKSLDTSIGWKKPIRIDTIRFFKKLKSSAQINIFPAVCVLTNSG